MKLKNSKLKNSKTEKFFLNLLLAGALTGLPLQFATADTIVTPDPNFATMDSGGNNVYPIGSPSFQRTPYQQIFDASLFGASPILISSFAFRANLTTGSTDVINLTSLNVTMSTTSKAVDGLSNDLSNNLGLDATMVINDPDGRMLSSDDGGSDLDFDYIFEFDTPFLYDPSQGNLIFQIDATLGAGNWDTSFDAADLNNDGTSRAYLNPNDTVRINTLGLITEFTFTTTTQAPEPSLLGLLSIGLMGAGIAYHRRKA